MEHQIKAYVNEITKNLVRTECSRLGVSESTLVKIIIDNYFKKEGK